jgi:predicted CoA-binding protein
MTVLPNSIDDFLKGKRFAVTGVSRNGKLPGNAIYKRLRASGYEAFPLNPRTDEVEGMECFPNLASVPGPIDGVVVASPPGASAQLVRDCREREIKKVWLHRSFGVGSVSEEAVSECEKLDVDCIVGGCPMMFCEPVDIAHRFMRWWLQRNGRVPK